MLEPGRRSEAFTFFRNPVYITHILGVVVGQIDVAVNGYYAREGFDYDIADDRESITFRDHAAVQGDHIQIWFLTPDVLDALAGLADE